MFSVKFSPIFSLILAIFTAVLTVPSAWGQTFKILHSFGNGSDGYVPFAGQVFDAQGNLYGITNLGGTGFCRSEGCGTVYQLKPNADGTWTESVIHSFDGNDGAYPFSSLIIDAEGNLYGSAWGESYYPDVVYHLAKNSDGSWTESTLHQFTGSQDGNGRGEVTLDASGNIYGTVDGGPGVYGTGIVFSLNRASGWQESIVHAFEQYPAPHGAGPYGANTFDGNGTFYGTTILGGAYNRGVIYKLTRPGGLFWRETVLYNFTGPDGFAPLGVILGPDGSLYGVTQEGGDQGSIRCGCGTVFRVTPNSDGTWTKTTIYAFRGGHNDGATPVVAVTFDHAGNIYGVTAGGGNFGPPACSYSGCGTVYKLTPSSGGHWTESIVYFFTGGLDGYDPNSPLTIDAAGNLYGAAPYGGVYQNEDYGGVAYEITP